MFLSTRLKAVRFSLFPLFAALTVVFVRPPTRLSPLSLSLSPARPSPSCRLLLAAWRHLAHTWRVRRDGSQGSFLHMAKCSALRACGAFCPIQVCWTRWTRACGTPETLLQADRLLCILVLCVLRSTSDDNEQTSFAAAHLNVVPDISCWAWKLTFKFCNFPESSPSSKHDAGTNQSCWQQFWWANRKRRNLLG